MRTLETIEEAMDRRSAAGTKLTAVQFRMLQRIPDEGLSQTALRQGQGYGIGGQIRTLRVLALLGLVDETQGDGEDVRFEITDAGRSGNRSPPMTSAASTRRSCPSCFWRRPKSRSHPMALNDEEQIPPPTSADLLAERIARLILDAREAGLSDGVILAELQDAANSLLEGLT